MLEYKENLGGGTFDSSDAAAIEIQIFHFNQELGSLTHNINDVSSLVNTTIDVISNMDSTINSLENTISIISNKINRDETSLGTISGNVIDLLSDNNIILNNIDSINNNLQNNNNDITTLLSDIDILFSNINNINNNLASLNTDVTTLENDTTSIAVATEFHFTQITPSNQQYVVHNLNKFPSVVVIDSTGDNEQVYGDVQYIDKNKLYINFTTQFSGEAQVE